MRLISILLLLPASASADPGFWFGPDGFSQKCAPGQESAISVAAAGSDAMNAFAISKVNGFVGAGGPAAVDQALLDEYGWWIGEMPGGDPAHPGPDLAAWKEAGGNVTETLELGRSRYLNGDILALCPPDGTDPCLRTAEGDQIGAAMRVIPLNGTGTYTISFCPLFFTLPTRGTGSPYQTQEAIVTHELAHVGGAQDLELPDFSAEAVHDLTKKDNGLLLASINAYNIQFTVAGMDSIQRGNGGHLIWTGEGCSATGSRQGPGLGKTFLCLILLAWALRPRRIPS